MLRRVLRLPDFPLIVAPFILLAPAWLTGRALFWGTPALQFVPWRAWAWEVLRSGRLPLWNPLSGMGAPLMANYQSALFYPPNWLYFLLAAIGGVPAMAWGQAILVAAHLAWAGLGMARLGRTLGLNELAQTVAGLAFGLSGYLVARAGFLSINAAAAWLPWVMLGVMRLPLSLSPPRPLALALCLAMQLLAGHAQTTWYTWLLAGMWVAFLCLSPMRRLATMIPLVLALLLALALAAIQLLPTAEYLLQSQRAADVGFDLTMTYSFWPWRFLTLVAPGLFGNPAGGDYWGYGSYWEDAVYIGLLPLLLAFSALLRHPLALSPRRPAVAPSPRRPVAPSSRFLLALILLSFTLALGDNTPIFPWLYHHIPTFDMFQAPTRFTLWAEFAFALLAGIGAHSWQRPSGRGLYWTRLGTAAAFAVMFGAALAWVFMGEVSPTFIRAIAMAGFWGVGAGVLTLVAPASSPEARMKVWQSAVVLFISADLLAAGWGLNPVVEADFYNGAAPTAEQIRAWVGEGRLYLPPSDEEVLKFDHFFRFDSFRLLRPEEDWGNVRAVLLPNANLLDGIASANNFDPLLPGRYERWMATLSQAQPTQLWRMLKLMGVTLFERVDESQSSGVRFDSLQALPRVRWLPCARPSQGAEDSLAQVLRADWNLDAEVILEDVAVQNPDCLAAEQALVQVVSVGTTVPQNPNRLKVHVRAESSGYLLIADTWYPGWTAKVDGRPTSILRANYLFRAVNLPAGEHEVTFGYRPISFYLGAVISLLAWLWVSRTARRLGSYPYSLGMISHKSK